MNKKSQRTLSEEFEEICREAHKLLTEDQNFCMMPIVEEEILVTIVSNSIKGVFDPLAQQLTELSLKIEELNKKDTSSQRNRPNVSSALPMRPLGQFSREFGESFSNFYEKFCQNLILQGVSLEISTFCSVYLE